MPDHLNSLVVGDVRLPRAGRTRGLRGKTTINISFGAGDPATARQRWTEIHPQVDALVQLPEVRARKATKPDTLATIPRLDPARIRTIAEQAYHGVLDKDGLGQVEPGFVTPVAEIILDRGQTTRGRRCDPVRVSVFRKARPEPSS